jgi:agmatinase
MPGNRTHVMTKQEKIASFDPSQPGLATQSIYGLPFTADESEIVIIPVPWEVTVSYGAGASEGPAAILEASFQELAQIIIEALENGEDINTIPALQSNLKKINDKCAEMNRELRDRTLYWMDRGKKVALLGGDHSTPLGYYEAIASRHDEFGILHLDAHMDLRIAYEGFTYSHASIMYNALQLPQVKKIVQVGIRDFCEQEVDVVRKFPVKVHTDADLKAEQFGGMSWKDQCDAIIAELPQNVLVSVDIDALQSWYCPNTGTPVPGGLSFEQATYLLTRLADSNKKILGFDLVEVAPGDDDWDGNVGARMLYHLCGMLAKNNGMATGNRIAF